MENTLVQVHYENSHEGLVDDVTLDELIRLRKVKRFYRPSEDAWVDVETGPIRLQKNHYDGPLPGPSALILTTSGHTSIEPSRTRKSATCTRPSMIIARP